MLYDYKGESIANGDVVVIINPNSVSHGKRGMLKGNYVGSQIQRKGLAKVYSMDGTAYYGFFGGGSLRSLKEKSVNDVGLDCTLIFVLCDEGNSSIVDSEQDFTFVFSAETESEAIDRVKSIISEAELDRDYTLYLYNGEKKFKIEFEPKLVEVNYEDSE